MLVRKFCNVNKTIVRFKFLLRIAKSLFIHFSFIVSFDNESRVTVAIDYARPVTGTVYSKCV